MESNRLQCKSQNIQKVTRENLCDLGFDNEFLDIKPKVQFMKEKKPVTWLTKIENFCSVKETAKRIKKQATNQKKYLQNTCLMKNLFKIYKELLKLNNKKTTNSVRSGPETLIDTSSDKIHRRQINR